MVRDHACCGPQSPGISLSIHSYSTLSLYTDSLSINHAQSAIQRSLWTLSPSEIANVPKSKLFTFSHSLSLCPFRPWTPFRSPRHRHWRRPHPLPLTLRKAPNRPKRTCDHGPKCRRPLFRHRRPRRRRTRKSQSGSRSKVPLRIRAKRVCGRMGVVRTSDGVKRRRRIAERASVDRE